MERFAGPIRSRRIAPPKPINQNSPRQILRHPRASPKCRRESTPEALGCFGATDRVGERPRSSGQTTAWPSRDRKSVVEGNRGDLGGRRIIKKKRATAEQGAEQCPCLT